MHHKDGALIQKREMKCVCAVNFDEVLLEGVECD